MSNFTELRIKDIQQLFRLSRYETARSKYQKLLAEFGTKVLTIYHVAQYLNVPQTEVEMSIK